MKTLSSKTSIVIAYLATCLFWGSIYVYVPILSTYCEGLGTSYTMIGIILSSYGLVQLIIRIPIGMFSDRVGKKKPFMIFGLVSSLVSGMVFFFAKTPIAMLIGRTLAGLSAATWAVFMVNFGSYYPKEKQSKGMGVIGTTSFIGQVVATLAGGAIATIWGERLTFLVSALVGLAAIGLVFTVPEKTSETIHKPKLNDFISMLKNKDLIYFSMLGVLMQIAVFSGVLGFVPNMLRSLGSSNVILGVATAFSSLFSIVTSLLSGTFFENKVGFKLSIAVSFFIVALMLILTGMTSKISLILLYVLLTSAPRGLIQTMLNSLAIRGIEPRLRSAAASVFQSIYGLGMTVGPAITGLIADRYGIMVAFITIGVFTLLAVVIILFRKKWPEWVG